MNFNCDFYFICIYMYVIVVSKRRGEIYKCLRDNGYLDFVIKLFCSYGDV